jgi:DnaJ like chaperone protein
VSWWGKLLGGTLGFVLGGPLGAAIGAVLGHNVDRSLSDRAAIGRDRPSEHERIQGAFFAATFAVMGRVAKADGRVSEAEIALANQVMQRLGLPDEMRHTARQLFNQGKSPTFPLEQVIEQFAGECGHRRDLARLFVEIQVQAACADGAMHAAERALLEPLCTRLGIRGAELDQIESLVRGTGVGGRTGPRRGGGRLDAAYAALGVTRSSSDDEVTRAYRRLLSQHHPDKLLSHGLPEEMIRAATQRTQPSREAYERVRESRGA